MPYEHFVQKMDNCNRFTNVWTVNYFYVNFDVTQINASIKRNV